MELIRNLPDVLAGKTPDPTGSMEQIWVAVGMQALGIVKSSFLVKSRGFTDEAGISWAKLSRKYVAYGRRHPGLTQKRGKAAAKGRAGRPLLTDAQDNLWRKVYSQVMNAGLRKGMSQSEASGWGARAAWKAVKAIGGKTIIGVFGDAPVEIGRNTGRMFNSLSPGSGDPDQVVKPGVGSVTVGTNVPHAGFFHARRPLWPADDAWPQRWLDRLQDTMMDGVALMLKKSLEN